MSVVRRSLRRTSPCVFWPPARRSKAHAIGLWRLALCLFLLRAAPAVATDLSGTVVDAGGAPLANAVVFVQTLPAGAAAPTSDATAVMDQVNKQFVPRVLPVMVGTAVAFPNHDQIHHHVYSFSKAKTFEIPLYKGEPAPPVVFDQLGAVTVGCNIHEWMRAVIVVLPTPYFAVTDASGAFTLRGVPAGATVIAAWHEGAKAGVGASAQTVEVGDATPALRFTLTVSKPRGGAGGGLRSYE